MPDRPLLLALDQGTTSTRAILFDAQGHIRAEARRPLNQHFPAPGLVEHDGEEIVSGAIACLGEAAAAADGAPIAALGITNQRETVLIWDRATGRPVHRAIVWQDRRTAASCATLKADGRESFVTARTGLLLDPYFSATKLGWMLEHLPDLRARAESGRLLAGTVDAFLIFRLTGGRVFASDITNASRTLLMNLETGAWDGALCALFGVPMAMLPEIRPSRSDFGRTDPVVTGLDLPILGIAGDQQAALAGQGCFAPGEAKATYGTGCFLLAHTGGAPAPSRHRMLTTAACSANAGGAFALEGAIFQAGAIVQWLRDGLGIIADAAGSEARAAAADPETPVVLVPAFTGLGAPWWDAEARGTIHGLTREAGPNELCFAALDAVACQTADLIGAMNADMAAAGIAPLSVLRVDGGMVANGFLCQRIADMTGLAVERPAMRETTAWGAALLAGLGAGVFAGAEAARDAVSIERRFVPAIDPAARERRLARWHDGVHRTLSAGAARGG